MEGSPLDWVVRDLSEEPAKQKSGKEPSRWRRHTKAWDRNVFLKQ